MYAWRKWTVEMRDQVLAFRQRQQRPWHGPPHFTGQQTNQYIITGTCYEHAPVIGQSLDRLSEFAIVLQQTFSDHGAFINAWCLLPNHYHVLCITDDLRGLASALGRLHGRVSRQWNLQDGAIGRQCWHRVSDRAMRSEAHLWATVNYIHHNPVKHGYVSQWTDWPWSSAHDYLENVGRKEAVRLWRAYPLGDYGTGWDDS
ncbi:putative transposase [Prosthecobacter fusiformis]|uniref:Putative transposase n=1 Tax=Prosthecobacter fusiformis TaxID=48464 RepID=A0A4V3FI43_9BACT|nr:putative transposase [Prosthecobacter fusiformis]